MGIIPDTINSIKRYRSIFLGDAMFKNRSKDGTCNLCGAQVARLRRASQPRMSQRALADRLQLFGVDVDKNAIQRIEGGRRFVTDIELAALAAIFQVSCDALLQPPEETR